MGVSSKMQVRAPIRSPHFWAPRTAPIFTAGRNRPRDVHYPGGTSAGAGGTRRQNCAGDSESWVCVWGNQVSEASPGSVEIYLRDSGQGGWEVRRSAAL